MHCIYNLRSLGFVELLGDRTLLMGFSYDQRENMTLLTPKAGEVSYSIHLTPEGNLISKPQQRAKQEVIQSVEMGGLPAGVMN